MYNKYIKAVSNTKASDEFNHWLFFPGCINEATSQPRQARGRGPHAVKEGPFREVPLAAMGDGFREHGTLPSRRTKVVLETYYQMYSSKWVGYRKVYAFVRATEDSFHSDFRWRK